jgi:hypothetical protein
MTELGRKNSVVRRKKEAGYQVNENGINQTLTGAASGKDDE